MQINNYSKNFNCKQTKFCKFEDDFTIPSLEVHFHIFCNEYKVMHSHNYWEFFLILNGSIFHKQFSKTEKISKGELVLVRPFDKHCFIKPIDSNYSQLNVMITDNLFKKLSNLINESLYDKITSQPEPLKFFIDDETSNSLLNSVHLIQLLDEKDYVTYQSLVKIMYLSVLSMTYKSLLHLNSSYPKWLNEFISEIKKPENINLKIEEIYKLSNYSYSHLIRLFKFYTNKTLVNYITDLKMSYAAKLLETTDMIILDISSKLGYDSLSHFNRIFKKYFNKTPSNYRKSIK